MRPPRFLKYATLATLLLTLAPTLVQAQDYTSNIISYWNFDETSGSTFTDQVGSNNGTWTDGVDNNFSGESVTGYFGNGILLDGVDDRINFGSDSSIDSIVPLTVCMWVNPVTFGSGYKNLITKTNNGGSDGWDFYTGSGVVGLSTWNGGYKQPGGLATGSWQHICVTWDGSAGPGGIDNYLNGTHLPNAGASWGSSSGDDANALVLGQRIGGSLGLNGHFDELRIYNRKLTAADISALFAYTGVDYTCTSPNGVTGEMLFNSDAHALQYCNASSWVGIGASDSLQSGLIGHWKLDETSGSSISDSSGNGNTGTWNDSSGNDVTQETAAGQINTGINFDGADDRIDVGNFDVSGSGLSIAGWFYIDSWTLDPRIISKASNGTATGNHDWALLFDRSFGSGEIGLRLKTTSSAIDETSTYVPNLNTWYHVVTTYNAATADIVYYIDGVQVDTDTHDDGGAVVTGSGRNITIGNQPTGAGSRPFDGTLDDIRVYDRPLSATEVSKLYTQTSSCNATTTNLAGHWTLNETSGSSITDSSGNGNTGTWNDGTGNDVTEETIAGQDGTAIDFDGADDRISIGSDASIENVFNGGGALSMWIYPESWGGCSYGRILEKAAGITGSGGWSIIVNNGGGVNPKENIAFYKGHSTTYSRWTTPFQSITLNAWNHITVSYSDDNLNNHPTIYINGTTQSLTQNNPPVGTPDSDVGTTMRIGYGGGCGFDGIIDDVRVYDGQLSETEVSAIYGATGGICSVSTCASPSGTTGEIVFNTDYDVMQYCNGRDWIAMGPPGDGGAGCTNPTGLAAELRYNTDAHVVQYCEGDEWIAVIGTNNTSIPTSGLIGYWTLDETSGTTAVDSSSSGNDGTLSFGMNAATDTAAGQVGTSLDFDGSDDQVIAAGTGLTTATTLSAWAYARSYGTNGSEIICEGGCDSPVTIGQRIVIYPASTNFSIWNATVPHVASTASVPALNSWHHYVGTFDGTVVKLYIDGVEVASTNYTGVFSARTPLRFGAANSVVDPDRAWNGMIDEVRIYDRALSSSEILSLYNATK